MGKYLDLNDVAHGHPVAERELRALLNVVREAIAVIDSTDDYYKGADHAALEALHFVILNHDIDKLVAAQEQNNEEPSTIARDDAARGSNAAENPGGSGPLGASDHEPGGGSSPSIHDFIAACVFAHAHKVVDAIAVEMHARAAQEALRRHDTPATEAEDDAASDGGEADKLFEKCQRLSQEIRDLRLWMRNVPTDEQLDAPVSALSGRTGRQLLYPNCYDDQGQPPSKPGYAHDPDCDVCQDEKEEMPVCAVCGGGWYMNPYDPMGIRRGHKKRCAAGPGDFAKMDATASEDDAAMVEEERNAVADALESYYGNYPGNRRHTHEGAADVVMEAIAALRTAATADADAVERVERAIGGLDLDDDSDCLAVALATYYTDHPGRPDPDPDDEDLGWGAWVVERGNAALRRIARAALAAARKEW